MMDAHRDKIVHRSSQRLHIAAVGRRAVLAALLAGALAVTGCSQLRFGESLSGVIQPAIVPSVTNRGTDVVERDFAFDGSQIRLQVPIDRAVYAGAVGARKSAIFLGEKEPPGWVADYYRAFVDEKHQDAFYGSLGEALHEVQQQQGLDSSEYVELVTSMGQGLEYRVDPGNLAPKFPIETLADGYGDCDDKALLAAAMLARDGYDVAILMFAPEKHVALGIRAPGLDYKNTGYAYVEMTEPSLVGAPAEELSGGTKLTSQPEVIKIGSGEKAYEAGDQIEYIQRRLAQVEAAQKRLGEQIDTETKDLKALEASLAKEKASLQSISDPTALVPAAERYNARVRSYNERVTKLGKVIDRYNALVDALRFVADHQTGRPQVYERLRALEL
jgi:hypothetical protein